MADTLRCNLIRLRLELCKLLILGGSNCDVQLDQLTVTYGSEHKSAFCRLFKLFPLGYCRAE